MTGRPPLNFVSLLALCLTTPAVGCAVSDGAEKSAGSPGGVVYPFVSETTSLSGRVLAVGAPLSINVQLEAPPVYQAERIPVSLVLILDRSGSMVRNLPVMKRAAQRLLSTLNGATDEVAIVTFHSSASLLVNFTSDFVSAAERLSDVEPGKLTNIEQGVKVAVHALRGRANPVRVGILFTDGRPEPDPIRQGERIQEMLVASALDQITIHTIGLGFVDDKLLAEIAASSGGEYRHLTVPSELEGVFKELYETQAKRLSVKALAVREHLHPWLAVEHGTFRYSSLPNSNDPILFDRDLLAKVPSFYQDGRLDLPLIQDFANSRIFTYGFRVRIRDCDASRDARIPLRVASAGLEYSNGSPTRIAHGYRVDSIDVRRCGVAAFKEWDEANRSLTIRVVNSLNTPVRDVHVRDALTRDFTFDRLPEASPVPSKVTAQGIEWLLPSMAAKSESTFRYFIRDVRPGPMGVYRLEVGEQSVRLTTDYETFMIRRTEPEFTTLSADLQRGRVSQSIAQEFRRRSNATATFINGTVTPAPPALRDRGYEWMLEFQRSLYDSFTGRFFVDSHVSGFEVAIEKQIRAEIPVLLTSPRYVPR